jgi:DNA-binding transcriptional MerR regulator/effector-binding domain-containing protein
MEYSIGDLSKITRVSGKTLHRYHAEGLVVPTRIDKFTSHRYYDETCLHRVEIVRRFHKIGIPLEVIKNLLARHKDTRHLVKLMQTELEHDKHQMEKLGLTHEYLQAFLQTQYFGGITLGKLESKILPDIFAACDHFRGVSGDFVSHFNHLTKTCGSAANGQPILLFHDDHQFEDEMVLESCLPVDHKIPAAGITFRTITGTKALTILYEGPAESIWMGYQKIIDHLNRLHLAIQTPSREVWLNWNENDALLENHPVRVEIQFLTGDVNDPTFTRDISRPGFGIDAQFDL